jgi:nicotinate-nucleotide pyrophosphorylase (carboxylating)
VAKQLFESKDVRVIFHLNDGCGIKKGDLLMSLQGNARDILLVERTALNLLMRMSGVASAANQYVNLVDGKVIIAGTRKTQPAIGKFDKYALKIGGADTHRFSLDDMVLIKDNHIAVVGSPIKALKKAQENVSFSKKIEIEVESLKDAILCVENKADIVMLDNMDALAVSEVIKELKNRNIRNNSLIEISGGINQDNILDYVDLGVDIISIGALTHSSRSLDFSLKIK